MMYDSEDELIDTTRCIVPDNSISTLEMRSVALSLPSVPTHVPVIRREIKEEAVASGDDDDDDEDYQEEKAPKKRKKRSTTGGGGKQRQKMMDLQANELIDVLQSMHQRGSTIEEADQHLSSLQLDEAKITGLKTSLFKFMQLSNKSSSATEMKMMKHLSSLQNDHPDRQLEDTIRQMSYASLVKATNDTEDAIVQAELELKRLKDHLKIHRFFLEVHPEKTQDRELIIQFVHEKLTAIEQKRFQEALAKTSARKMFARRMPSSNDREVEV
jgi:hypothetical protein